MPAPQPSTRSGQLVKAFATASLLILVTGQLVAQTPNTVYRFKGGNNGYNPLSTMISDAAGNLYGTTYFGGSSNCGTVYKLTPPSVAGKPWTQNVLYAFTCGADGGLPSGGVSFDKAGNLYGMNSANGASESGVVYQLTPPQTQGGAWGENTLYNFTSYVAGPSYPFYLYIDKTGNLFGYLSCFCGSGGGVFELSPPATQGGAWTFNQIYAFSELTADGADPLGGLTADAEGNLYGTTIMGGTVGAYGSGTVFRLARPTTKGGAWTETVLYRFQGVPDGASPADTLMFGKDGNLYGTTSHGGAYGAEYGGWGTIFQLAPPVESGGAWTETLLYNFQSDGDGAAPVSGVIEDPYGNLYGIASPALFQLSPPASQGGAWTETTLANFSETGIGLLYGGLTLRPKLGILYGVTQGGGVCTKKACFGTVFSLRP